MRERIWATTNNYNNRQTVWVHLLSVVIFSNFTLEINTEDTNTMKLHGITEEIKSVNVANYT